MSKAAISFKQGRKALLLKMSARAGRRIIKKVIRFRNDDVPKYLRDLDKFETASRNATLVVT
jgi:hypothetical protein